MRIPSLDLLLHDVDAVTGACRARKAARAVRLGASSALLLIGLACGAPDGDDGESTFETASTANGSDTDPAGSTNGDETDGATGDGADGATGDGADASTGAATTADGCGAAVGEPCNPDVCQCAGGPMSPVLCRLNPDAEYECVDTTPQNNNVGDMCDYNFECASGHCYTLVSGDPRVCQEACIPEETEVPGDHGTNATSNCCGGFASCSNETCTCG